MTDTNANAKTQPETAESDWTELAASLAAAKASRPAERVAASEPPRVAAPARASLSGALALVLAKFFGDSRRTTVTREDLAIAGALMAVPLILIARQPDLGTAVTLIPVGFAVAYLATPYARRMTGSTVYVDGGVNIMA